MKKTILFSAFLLVVCIYFSFSNPISISTANQVAENFFRAGKVETLSQKDIKLLYVAKDDISGIDGAAAEPYFYVYSGDGKSFVIVAGDDAVRPILGFSFDSDFRASEIPENVQFWLNTYKKQIEYARQNAPQSIAFRKEWEKLLSSGAVDILNTPDAVSPLTRTKWNQAPFYNAFCPYDDSRQSRTVAGCVAIAMAQVMRYWAYPSVGVGSHSYNHYKLGTISASFSDEPINWKSFPNQVFTTNEELAYAIFLIGVSVEMRYGVDASGAFVISKRSPKQHCSEYALKTYWKYDAQTLVGLPKSDTTDAAWLNIIKNELKLGRPIIYTGAGPEGGHAWVCDGYREDDYFSMNWGWGGAYNGYYALNALSPGTGGIGSGSGTFNDNQEILYGIQPIIKSQSIMTISGNGNFKDTPLGTTSQTTLFINNLGEKAFNVTAADVPQGFSLATPLPIRVDPGKSAEIVVAFSPKYATTYSGNLFLTTDAELGTNQFQIKGKGTANQTSILENSDNFEFELFPNPAVDFVAINTSKEIEKIEVTDVLGNKFMEFEGLNLAKNINLSQLTSGSYYIGARFIDGKVGRKLLLITR